MQWRNNWYLDRIFTYFSRLYDDHPFDLFRALIVYFETGERQSFYINKEYSVYAPEFIVFDNVITSDSTGDVMCNNVLLFSLNLIDYISERLSEYAHFPIGRDNPNDDVELYRLMVLVENAIIKPESYSERKKIIMGMNSVDELKRFNRTLQKDLAKVLLGEFQRLNTSCDDVCDIDLLIILKDGTNLTRWDDVQRRGDVIFISEDLSKCGNLKEKYECFTNLELLIVRNVTQNATDMYSMFGECNSLKYIFGFDTWDVSNVENMDLMFVNCESLKFIEGCDDWNISKVKSMLGMFFGCRSLSDLMFLRNWNTGNVEIMCSDENLQGMFFRCESLSSLTGLEGWDVSNITDMYGMFYECKSLTDVSSLKNWDVNKVITFEDMFRNCKSLLDLSAFKNWDVGNASYFWMFVDCKNLLDASPISDWDISGGEDMDKMFLGCVKIEKYPKWYDGQQ